MDNDCTWGCKRNSQGNVQFWKGYKLHLDVTDSGIPVTAVVTGVGHSHVTFSLLANVSEANVHDSQVAIPMKKLKQRNITRLYSLSDAGAIKRSGEFTVSGSISSRYFCL